MSSLALALVTGGVTLTFWATLAEAATGWPGVRRVGRWVLAVLGPLTRPARWLMPHRAGRPGVRVTLNQAILDELRAELERPLPRDRCARRGHDYRYTAAFGRRCRRCRVPLNPDGTTYRRS